MSFAAAGATDGLATRVFPGWEGNRTHRFVDGNANGQLDQGDTEITEYTWDHRNRLVKVEHRPDYAAAVDRVTEYANDYQSR